MILCEGDNDSAFFQALIANRGIPDFQVMSPNDFDPYEGGVNHFARVLSGFWALTTFSTLRAILVIADNDVNPAASLQEVRNEIGRADPEPMSQPVRRFAVPGGDLQKAGADPIVTIMMLPLNGQPGNLESLCLAATTLPAVSACVDTFAHCTGVDQWDIAKRSKSKLRSLIAGAHRPNPEMSLTFLWRYRPDIVPLNHAAFTPIAQFLLDFPNFLQQP